MHYPYVIHYCTVWEVTVLEMMVPSQFSPLQNSVKLSRDSSKLCVATTPSDVQSWHFNVHRPIGLGRGVPISWKRLLCWFTVLSCTTTNTQACIKREGITLWYAVDSWTKLYCCKEKKLHANSCILSLSEYLHILFQHFLTNNILQVPKTYCYTSNRNWPNPPFVHVSSY